MSVEHVYYCDGPDCDTHVRSTEPPPRPGWLLVTAGEPDQRHHFDFCTWECAIRYGAGTEPVETLTAGGHE